MLKDWNTLENANLLERKLLKRVDELPIGTTIYGLNPDDNEIGLWTVDKKSGDVIYLYEPMAYIERTFIVKTDDDEEIQFKDTDICKAREYFKDKTYKHVDIKMGETTALETPNTSRFYFNVYHISKKSYEVKIETIDTRHWVDRIHYKTYVLPTFNSKIEPYYPNVKNLQQIAENIHSILKYRFKNPNEYEVCDYLIYSKDSHDKKLKTLEKLQGLPDNYNVVDIDYNKYSDEITIRIDETKVDLDTKISDGAIKLLDLQECHRCNCATCEYKVDNGCGKNIQMMQNSTPCHLYSPHSLYKLFKAEWDKSTEEDKQTYLDYVKNYLYFNGHRVVVSRKDNVIYYTDDTDRVFDRNPNEIIKAEYKKTYYPRRKKNKVVIEKL